MDLLAPLKQYWGYRSFRPKQEEVIRCLLAGRDAVAVMPTGGGKSLCYQLASLALDGTAIVISPLIALMQDQAADLETMGIPAAVLNSSLDPAEQFAITRRAREGRYRLLYLSPERLVREDTLGWLKSAPISFFAIDEAHCISEWGHEFRPEYRQLSCLRENFPDKPVAAFTASATRRVRHDIVVQLNLNAPGKFVLSFYRPNLRILVKCCDAPTQEQILLAALQQHAGSNVIIYSPTIARVGETVALLERHGIRAVPYHGKMEAETRRQNQEIWMSDEVPVLVGTIAFGLGINKPSVRAVIHLSLPKSIEQYYQEAGRAGRDGEPADCLLLWQKKDAGLLSHFVRQIEDAEERSRAWDRYHTVRRFAESDVCRHRQICTHFGQQTSWERCEACDVCGDVPEWAGQEAPARARRRKARVKDPLLVPGEDWSLPAPDPALLEHLRRWRLERARRRHVPAYVILNDKSLMDLCRRRPASHDELLAVHGIGEHKANLFGEDLLSALAQFGKDAGPSG